MNPVSTPISRAVADLTRAFAGDDPRADAVAAFLAPLDAAGWTVQGYRLLETEGGTEVRMRLPVLEGAEAELPVPGFPAFSVFAKLPDEEGELSVMWGRSNAHLELRGFRFGLRVDHTLLVPLDGGEAVELAFEGSLRLRSDWTLELIGDHEISLEECEIVGTGVQLSLSGVRFDFSRTHSPPPLIALGYDGEFRGLFARSGTLRLFPQTFFEEAGLAVEIRDAALGKQGFTGRIEHYWSLEHDGTSIEASSEKVGSLLSDRMPIGLARVEAVIRDNRPQMVSATGVMRLPPFGELFEAELGMDARPDESGFRYGLRSRSLGPGQVDLGFGTIAYDAIALAGVLDQSAFSLSGEVSDLTLNLPRLQFTAAASAASLAHDEGSDELRMRLQDVQLGPLGKVDIAELIVRRTRTDAGEATDVQVECALSWADLRSRVTLPQHFPEPLGAGSVRAVLTWTEDAATGQRQATLQLRAAIEEVDRLWTFVPQAVRPRVPRAELALQIVYAREDAFFDADDTDSLSGSLWVDLDLELPPLSLPGDLVDVRFGNADGRIRARLEAGVNAQGAPAVQMSLHDLVAVDLQIPGLPQPHPPIHLELDGVELELRGGAQTEGKVGLAGSFAIRPVSPPASIPIAAHLEHLLEPLYTSGLTGQARLDLRFKNGKAELALTCSFANASVEVDVFDMVSNLARGFAPPAGTDGPAGEVDLNLEVGFALRHLAVNLGSLDQTSDAPAASLELGMAMWIGSLMVDGHIRLSDRQLALGLTEARVPLQMPAFPLRSAEIASLQTGADWTSALTQRQQRIAALAGSTDRDERKELVELRAQEFLLARMFEIRQKLSGPGPRNDFRSALEMLTAVLDTATGITHTQSNVELVLKEVQFVVPFSDPRAIRIEGTAHLEGFAPGDPFRALEGIQLGLGLSADRIFFSVASVGSPIPLPDFGRYPGGSVDLSQLTIGYGYTKNSFSMTFAGALVLPPQLIEDADTSRSLGAGVRLPSHTRVGFRFDLIPVPGPIPAVPLFEFELDMRAPNSPALLRENGVTRPFWDGLQTVVPDIIHTGVKHVALSPFLGPLPVPNARFDGDLQLGNDSNGVTIIADNFLFLAGLGMPPTPIPLIAEPYAPYFDNLYVQLRVAGFGVHFNLQRPFPGFSPFALFEALGLLADPMLPVEPDGALANSVRVALQDATITLPPEVLRLFPEAARFSQKPLNVTINLGTFITAMQEVARSTTEVMEVMEEGGLSVERRVRTLLREQPFPSIGVLLQALPPELRKLRFGASFAGFEARAVLLLLDANDMASLATAMDQRGTVPAAPGAPSFAWGQPSDPAELEWFRPNFPERRGGARTYFPSDPEANLFNGIEFESFGAADLAAIPPHRNAGSTDRRLPGGVVVGAHVKVFGGQRFRFLGYVFEDGSFSMVTGVDIPPLRLSVAGIPVTLPFKARGRLSLAGRAQRDGFYGALHAQGYGSWNVVLGLVRLEFGTSSQPVNLELRSDGRFALQGSGRLLLWNGAARVEGQVDVSETHCFVEGTLAWQSGMVQGRRLVDLVLSCRGRVGPGERFELGGAGSLKILGQPLLGMRGTITDRGVAVEGRLDTGTWVVAGSTIPCELRLGVRGMLNLRKAAKPEFLLEGSGTADVFGVRVEGRGQLASRAGNFSTSLEGSLRWQGREWLGGRLDLDAQGVGVHGHTSFALALSPSNLAGLQLANLFLKVDLEGGFRLDTGQGLASFEVKGDWMLGATAAGSGQFFPLATHRFPLTRGATMELELIHTQGFRLVPLGNLQSITVPIPIFKPAPSQLKFGTGPLILDGLPGMSWNGKTFIGGDIHHRPKGVVHGSIPYAFNRVSDTTTISLPFNLSDTFRLAVVWHQNRLAVRVSRGGNIRYHYL
jgi:hypothetical protein